METNITTSEKGCRIDLGKMEIIGDSGGLKIRLQSNKNFNFLRDETTEKTFKLGGVECYMPRHGNESNLAGVPGHFFTQKDRFQIDGYLNLSLLLAKDLEKGVEFEFPTFPIQSEKVKEFGNNFNTQIKSIFAAYMRTTRLSMTFQANIVDVETI